MANLIDPTELMFTAFEPKVTNRFVFYIDGIPSYLIRAAARPKINNNETEIKHINNSRFIKGRSTWDAITVELYDPIVPSGAQAVMEWVRLHHESVTGRNGYADFYKKDISINVLGPVGDKVEEWTGKGAFIVDADFGAVSWENDAAPAIITMSLRADYWILQY
tara:strand:+ start:7824 stop:8315 length:492 start_codon:yes stop_codon:yes gene_type:complete